MRLTRRGWLLSAALAGLTALLAAVGQEGAPPADGAAPAEAPVIDATALPGRTTAPAPVEAPPAPAELTPPDLGPLQVTVYGDGTGLIRQRRSFAVRVGDNELTLDGVARQLDPTTVRLRPLDPAAGLRVLEQTALGAAEQSAELMQAAVGRNVRLRDGRYSVEGTLLAVEEGGIILATADEVHVHPRGELILPRLDELPGFTPRLLWRATAETAGEIECEVSYVTRGLTWTADYALTLGADDRQVACEAWVRLTNQAGVDLTAAGVLFTTGGSGPVDASAAARPVYWVPRPVDLTSGASKRLALLDLPAVRSRVRYVATLPPTGPVGVRLAAELVNDAAGGLGRPLPPGPVRLYAPDRLGRLNLIGEQQLAATPPGQTLRFDLGATDDVTIELTQVGEAGGLRRTAVVRNLRTEDATVQLIEQRPGAWQVTQASTAFGPPSGGRAAAEITVPGNGSAKVTWVVREAGPPAGEGSPT